MQSYHQKQSVHHFMKWPAYAVLPSDVELLAPSYDNSVVLMIAAKQRQDSDKSSILFRLLVIGCMSHSDPEVNYNSCETFAFHMM